MERNHKPASPKNNRHLLGIGLDAEDGHKRITRAEDFSIVGGSAETHEGMTETLCKTFEDLKSTGKDLNNVEPEHLRDLIHKNLPS